MVTADTCIHIQGVILAQLFFSFTLLTIYSCISLSEFLFYAGQPSMVFFPLILYVFCTLNTCFRVKIRCSTAYKGVTSQWVTEYKENAQSKYRWGKTNQASQISSDWTFVMQKLS